MAIGGQAEQMDQISIDIDKRKTLAESLRVEISSLPHLYDERCIFRVPQRFRDHNDQKEYYSPRLLSIGPLHHGKESLKPMEKHKMRYLGEFLKRTQVTLEEFINVVEEQEERLRGCYGETIHFDSHDFVKIVLVDAIFIIELLSVYALEEWRPDHIHGPPRLVEQFRFDLCLVENQLPFFILEDLFGLAGISKSFDKDQPISLAKLIIGYGKFDWDFLAIEDDLDDKISGYKPKHLVDLLRSFLLPSKFPHRGQIESLTIPSAIELHRAGVKFRLGQSKNLFDVRFDKEKGVLEIPRLRLVNSTGLVLTNIIAYEQCLQEEVYCVADYIAFMNYLANSAEDVELLIQSGIIDNWLENSSDVSNVFKSIGKETNIDCEDFRFAALVESLKEYCSSPTHRWIANLKQNYFNNPWASISVIAASILLLLTIIETVCSILQVV